MARLIALAALVGCATALTACVPSRTIPGPTRTILETQIRTGSPQPSPAFTPPPARTVAPLPPGASPSKGELEKKCPYIASSPDDGPNSVADIIGSHVLRTTVITTTRPVGCRFYFYSAEYQAIADIVPRTFATARAAYAAVIATGNAGTSAEGRTNIVPGVDAVLYRTRFYGPDGARDWACVFAAGSRLVIVHSQRDDMSFSVLRLAKVVAPKFVTSR